MLTLQYDVHRPWTVLCLGAHCDDIEIGCGGTLLRLLAEHPGITVHWVVFSSTPERASEARAGAAAFLAGARAAHVVVEQFRDGYFPYQGAAIKDYFEQLQRRVTPDLVFTHYRNDAHQDHRLICELTWNTFRHHPIFEYEIPKYDGDLGAPNVFVALDEATCKRKAAYLLASYPTQARKHWFTESTFLALMRLRGIEASNPSPYAEGFYCRKLTI